MRFFAIQQRAMTVTKHCMQCRAVHGFKMLQNPKSEVSVPNPRSFRISSVQHLRTSCAESCGLQNVPISPAHSTIEATPSQKLNSEAVSSACTYPLRSLHSPQTDAATCVASALILPRAAAWLFVSVFIAASATLKPDPAWSIASTLMLRPLYVSVQHVPHAASFQPAIAAAPPMFGNWGASRTS